MGYKCEQEVRVRAEQLVRNLKQGGFEAQVVPYSFRDYNVKVSVARDGRVFGNIIVYYSPKKESYKLGTHELKDKSVEPELQACWEGYELQTDGVVESVALRQRGYAIYVDGSYMDNGIGYGFVVLKDGEQYDEGWGPVDDPFLQGMRQVGGELKAVYEALAWCEKHGVTTVSIFADLQGSIEWATGTWQTNTAATQEYARAVAASAVSVEWHKVAGHSGDRWNDYVDGLAKRGAAEQVTAKASEVDPLSEVERKACEFVALLAELHIEATSLGVKNGQFVRIVTAGEGYLDIYRTKKRSPADPYVHGFKERALAKRVESLWVDFWSGRASPDVTAGGEGDAFDNDERLREVRHYYQILEPYRDFQFDFVMLAHALQRAYVQRERSIPNIDTLRYDFDALERLLHELTGGNNDAG